MPLYAFKGIGPSGKPVNGARDADSPKALRQLMRRDGVVVTSCELSKGGTAKTTKGGKGLSRDVDLGGLFGGVSKPEIANFTRQLATLLRAGIPLAEALGALFEQIENVRLKVPIGEVRTAVNEGSSLADALGKHKKLFDDLYISMIRAGELAGNLDTVLARLADFLDSSQKIRGKVQAAMVYPILMLGVGTVLMAILMVAVIPEITGMFKQSGKVLPLKTRALIGVSDFIRDYILLLVPAIIGGIIGFRAWAKSKAGQPVWHAFILRMPVVGKLAKMINVGRFARTLGTMLQSGVPMLRALDTAKEIVSNVIMRRAVEDAKKAVTEGDSLALTLKRSGHFPPTTIHMIATGEKSGQLEQMLNRIADDNEAEVDRQLQRMTSLLEPLMLILMAVGVGFVVFAILEPIMDMSTFGGRH
ncbi:MAG: type II secretion system inner membrane protein GspF [Kofleriaceae bacterium]|nr:type II secretion system inner membrane protein GspF [Myxococcales bacterium]MCB9560956.1 type II secretion system inner membrane protein GspF [Kofleriaceae bacterium]MCB9574996.1 type II secretion system inner membrane protein GspF [Kofleriaceae bacterium]